MAGPGTVLRSIKEAIKDSDRLPSATSYGTFELDFQGGQANVRPPVVEITTVDVIRSDTVNTDFVGYSQDENGNDIGRIYRAGFEMPVEVRIVTAEGGDYDPVDMGGKVRLALYRYEDRQEHDPLPDPDGTGILADVTHFELGDGGTDDDFGMTPALRGWRQEIDVWFEEVIDTAEEYGEEDYVVTVDSPKAGEEEAGTTIAIVYDVSPNQASEADEYT